MSRRTTILSLHARICNSSWNWWYKASRKRSHLLTIKSVPACSHWFFEADGLSQIVSRRATNLTPAQLEQFESTFRYFDRDESNTLNEAEMTAALASLGIVYSVRVSAFCWTSSYICLGRRYGLYLRSTCTRLWRGYFWSLYQPSCKILLPRGNVAYWLRRILGWHHRRSNDARSASRSVPRSCHRKSTFTFYKSSLPITKTIFPAFLDWAWSSKRTPSCTGCFIPPERHAECITRRWRSRLWLWSLDRGCIYYITPSIIVVQPL